MAASHVLCQTAMTIISPMAIANMIAKDNNYRNNNNIIVRASKFVAPSTNVAGGNLSSILLGLRGGQVASHAAAAAFDMSRESYAIAELATYGTLTALVMNTALRLWTSTKFKKEQSPIVSHGFIVCKTLCVISGVFTVILFQLLCIYSKSVLSFHVAFKTATAIYRKWGFRCFLMELSTFMFSFLLSLYNTVWMEAREHDDKELYQRVGTYIVMGSAVLLLLGAFHIHCVLDLATKHIFTDPFSSSVCVDYCIGDYFLCLGWQEMLDPYCQ
jgi:hypothetical protein